MNNRMTNEQRVAPAIAWAEECIKAKRGNNRPPNKAARLLVLICLLHRKEMPFWLRKKVKEFTS